MDCQQVRMVLWPADVLRVSDADVEIALRHADDCEECTLFLEQDRRVAELIRDAVPRARAPRALRERLYTALARERAGAIPDRGRRWRGIPAHIVAAVLLVGLAFTPVANWLFDRGRPDSAAAAFAEDYLRRVVEQEELASTDGEEIASFFARELGISVTPPEIPEFKVKRASICLMNGRRGGVVEYGTDGRHISYYLVPLGEDQAMRPLFGLDIRQVSGGTAAPAALANERGLGVATWWDRDHQYALVGNLSVEELKRIAPLFTTPRLVSSLPGR